MDPQHRVFLELCWSAMEDAGVTPESLQRRIGVFAGGGRHAYLRYVERNFTDSDWLDGSVHGLQSDIGNYGDFLATRVSYRLGLTAPSMNVQTACSTGLMAVHVACQSITHGECEAALAGAVNIHTPQVSGYHYEEGSICSESGRLRAFDERADGSVFGNGAGVVLLKSLRAAVRDGDRIVAVIRASASNNDGNDKMSFTAPSVSGQAAVIERALLDSGCEPASIGYVEAHGTGTPLGDPIEIDALNAAFSLPGGGRTCALGTAKPQIGHLGPAAGIIGLIRAAMVVDKAMIPKCVNFEVPSSRIAWNDGPFYVPKENEPWMGLRRAGVSAFGVGGTNVHVVLEQAPAAPEITRPLPDVPVPIVVSAQTQSQLRVAKQALADHLTVNSDVAVLDVARTLALGRTPEKIRSTLAAVDTQELVEGLRAPGIMGVEPESPELPLVMAFPGQGSQYARAANGLYLREPSFAAAIDECAEVLAGITEFDIRDVMFPSDANLALASSRIHRAQRAQEALFVFEYSLGRALIEAGLTPSIMIGHSAGEYSAAALSGVLSLEDALLLVSERGRLMEHVAPPGAMLAVGLTPEELASIMPDTVDLAAVNAPGQCVVSGSVEAIASMEEMLNESNVMNRVLGASLAAHSRLMDTIRDEFGDAVRRVKFGTPVIPLASTKLGNFESSTAFAEHSYWIDHLRQPVRFMEAAEAVLEHGRAVILEVGPGRALVELFRQLDGGINLPGLSPWRNGDREPESIAEVVGSVWELGGAIDWGRHFSGTRSRSISLPGRQHDRKIKWTKEVGGRDHLPHLVEESLVWAPRWALTPRTIDSDVVDSLVVFSAGTELSWSSKLNADITVADLADLTSGEAVENWFDANRDAVATADAFVFIGQAPVGPDAVDVALERDFWPLLRVGPMISAVRPDKTNRLLVLNPTPEAADAPAGELVVGPYRVLPQEYPGLETSLVRAKEISASLIEDEVASFVAGAEIAYFDGFRYRRVYKSVPAALGPDPWRSGSTYLITGGTGGIGLALAKSASSIEDVRMVLTRRPVSRAGARDDRVLDDKVAQLRELGLTVEIADVDVRDSDRMKDLYREYGPFDGVAHAAGVAGGRLIAALDEGGVRHVMSPKIDGARVLDEEVIDDQTRWVALCSSMSSVVGGVGHADYSSANAYLDAFAEKMARSGRDVVSIAFDAWTESGMAVNETNRSFRQRLESSSSRVETTNSFDVWSQQIHAGDWVLHEHRVDGRSLLSGTAIIEILHRAVRELTGTEVIQIQALDILRPADCADDSGLTVEVALAPEDSGWRATARCGEFGSRLLPTVTALITRAPGGSESSPSKRPMSWFESEQLELEHLDESLIQLGPRWDCLVGIRELPNGETVARSVLPGLYADDLHQHPMHPALLDNALGASLSKLGERYVPQSYERIDVWGSLSSELISHTRVVERSDRSVTLDVDCWSPAGDLLVSVRGYHLRRIDSGQMFGAGNAAIENRSLHLQEAADLSSMVLEPAPRPQCGPTDVIVKVRATGLNFKEVLLASGLMDDTRDHSFGLECSGIVVEVGSDVQAFGVGDAVLGIGEACLDDYVALSERLVRRIPRGLSFAEAATVPVAFTTAFECLVLRANAKRGQSVLIHAVTGGVGLAAVQIARHLGLTIIGTASTLAKREYARELGVTAVFDSRSTEFEQQVRELGGVDIVLNSLGGEFIEASMRTLKQGGRLVEMGRRDILAERPMSMALFSHGVSFVAYYPDQHSPEYEESLDSVMRLLRKGEVQPLPAHAFPTSAVSDAYTHLAQAKHIGKVIVVREDSAERVWTGNGYVVHSAGISDELGVSLFKRSIRLKEPRVMATLRPMDQESDELVVATHVLDQIPDSQGSNSLRESDLEGETEERLGEIWAAVLRLDSVSRSDSFMALGGDSLYATQVVSRINREFGVRLPPSALLGGDSLRDMAVQLSPRPSGSGSKSEQDS
ncbi:hypothetical protein GCM10011359_13300 [Nesterenkonia alkaliphila]|nr:hypothetical protein GCM10011359_13300 [Nesterenkonia alkaliphila]